MKAFKGGFFDESFNGYCSWKKRNFYSGSLLKAINWLDFQKNPEI